MSAWDTIKNLITFTSPDLPPIAVKEVPANTELFGPIGQRSADWAGVNDANRSDAYRKCATAYACATFLADAVSEAPLRVYKIIDGDLQEQPGHRLRTVLTNPNPYLSEAELMGLTVMSMAMFGYGVVEKVRSAARIPVQLWPLRPDWLTRTIRNDGVRQWEYRRPNADPRVIAEEDLILIPYRHDERQVQIGISPLQIIAREIGIDVALTDLLKVFLDAGGIPPWAVEVPDPNPKQAEIDVFRERWRQTYSGTLAYSNIGVLYGGMKLHKVGDSIGDMAWPDLRGLTEMKIAQAFRVPADLIQARDSMSSGSLTTTEMEGSMAALQMYGAHPLRQRIDGAFTRSLLPDFTGGDQSYTVEFDTSEILSLQEDRNALHDRVRADFDAGAITLNQYLNETGRSEIGAAGEVYKVSFTTMYVPAASLAGNEPAPVKRVLGAPTIRELPIGKVERRYVDRKTLTEAETKARTNVLTLTNRNRQKLTEIGTRKLRTFFRKQGEQIVAALKADGSFDIKAAVIDWDEQESLLDELMTKYYAEVGKSAYGAVGATTGADLSWDLANPNISRVMDQLGTRVTDISNTTRTDVQRVIADGLADGLTHTDLAKQLETMFTETYKGRAQTIARTESAHAYNKASALGYQESGVIDEVELVDNPAHDTDPEGPTNTTCAERDGMRVSVNDVNDYTDSMHPNCIMAVIPILNTQLGG